MKQRKKENIVIYRDESEQSNYRYDNLWLISSCIYVLGLQLLLMGLTPVPVRYVHGASAAVWIFFGLALAANRIIKKGDGPVTLLALILALATTVLTGVSRVFGGGIQFLNYAVQAWNQKRDDSIALFEVSDVGPMDIMLFMAVFSFLVLALCMWFRRVKHAYLVSVTAAIPMILVLLTDRVSWWGMSLLILAQLIFYTDRISSKLNVRSFFWLGFVVLVLTGISHLVGDGTSSVTYQVREQARQKMEDFRYGQDDLPEGDLYKAHEMQQSEEERLKVETRQIKTIYLYGFTGAEYEKGRWQPVKNAKIGSGHNSSFYWLEQRGFDANQVLASYYHLDKNNKNAKENEIKIENTGADRQYLYLPLSQYEIDGSSYKEKGDQGCRGTAFRGSYSYTVKEYSTQFPGELLSVEKWVEAPETSGQKQYLQSELSYRRFVYDNYTDVDASLQKYITAYFFDTATTEDKTGVYAITKHIRNRLAVGTAYTETPSAMPEGQDPIYWFLAREKKGNSALYASAAVEAFRRFGIPARYAEGYLLQKSQVEENQGQVTLTGKDGHAWVQVYMDAVGWVDIDVTPGFYYDEYALMKMVESPDGVQMTAELDEENTDPSITKGNGQESGDGSGSGQTREKLILWLKTLPLLLAMLFVLWITGMEFMRYNAYRRYQRSMRHGSREDKGQVLHRRIMKQMWALSIKARIGWNKEETEAFLRKRCPSVKKEEYMLVNRILEKNMYGGQPLEEWEIRKLMAFSDKLFFDVKIPFKHMIKKIRHRYCFVWQRKMT